VIKDCPETKTPTGGGGKKETPKKHPKHAQRTATGLYFVTVNTATDGQTWCTYGDGIDTPISLTDDGGNPVAVATLDSTTTLEEGIRTDDTSRTSEEKATATPGVPELPPSAPTAEGRTTTTLGPPTEQLLPPPTAAAPPTEQMSNEAPPTNAGPPVEQPSKPTTTLTEVPPQQPPKEPTTPLTEVPPQQPPLTPTTYDRINAKVRQKVLEALLNAQGSSQEPPPEKGQLVKLTPQDKQEPPTKTKTVENADNDPRGFDKDPLQCTTSVDGDCSMQIPTEDRELYGLPGTSAEPSKTYRVSFDKSQTSGGVAETTGRHLRPESPPTDGAEIIRHEFAIGNRTYVRIVYKKPFGLDRDLSRTFSEFYGSKYEEDSCRDKEPGPPLGMQPHSLSGLNQEIPEAMVKLRGIPRNRGATR
jgi:hypothetical protein